LNRIRSTARRIGDRNLAKDTLWGFGFEGIQLVGTVISFSLLGRSLGLEGYGHYASLYAIIGPLGTLAASGVTLAQAQHVIRDGEDLEETSRSCVTMTLGIGLMLTLVGALIASRVVDGLAMTAVFAVLLLEFVSYPSVLIAANTVQIRDGYAASTPVRVIPILARIVAIFVLFAVGHLSILTLGITYLIITAVLSQVLSRQVGRRYDIRLIPGKVKKQHFKTSATYSAGISGLSLQNDGDKAVLTSYGYVTDTGLYSAAYKVVQFGFLPVGSFVSVTHNHFLEHQEGRKSQHLRRSIRFGGICVVYGLLFTVGVFLAAPLLPLLVGKNFDASVGMVRWLAPLVLLRSMAIFPLNGLMGLGKTGVRTILLLASAAVSMALYIILSPHMQWKGAAIGTLLGEGALAVASWVVLVIYQRSSDRAAAQADAAEAKEHADVPVAVGSVALSD
jgi:O-antigen/teichoic acid export membrane protein